MIHILKTDWPTKILKAIFEFLGQFALGCTYVI